MPETHPADRTQALLASGAHFSLRKGKRATSRTQVCRPCLIWLVGSSQRHQGVVLDLNPRGMKIRALWPFSTGAAIVVQMMRDEEFQVPLSPPIEATVLRAAQVSGGFFDHGIKVHTSKPSTPQGAEAPSPK